MERINLRLTVDLEYEAEGEIDVQMLRENLAGILNNAYSNGLFTEDTEAEIYCWDSDIEEIQK